MKYVSIDIESTGVNVHEDEVLEFSAIFEDSKNLKTYSEIFKFTRILLYQRIAGSPFALDLNKDIIQIIGAHNEYPTKPEVWKSLLDKRFPEKNNLNYGVCYPKNLGHAFSEGLKPLLEEDDIKKDHLTFNVAGKNIGGFDALILSRLPNWNDKVRFRRRFVDPTTPFIDWENDLIAPNLSICKTRSNLSEVITHNSLEDAWDVIEVMRTQYNRK